MPDRRLSSPTGGIDRATAHGWIERYEAMMCREVAHRSAQQAAVADAARRRLSATPHPRLVDLGCGPGSLARRLAEVVPDATVVGIDADPVLLGLAAAVAHPRVLTIAATIGSPGWSERLAPDGPVDLAVAVAVVHYLDAPEARRWYAEVAALLAPDGALVLADAFACAGSGTSTSDQAGTAAEAETWSAWWAAVAADPLLQQTWPGRSEPVCDGDHRLELAEHTAELRAAGFGSVTTVWQVGGHAVLVAARR